MKKIFFLLFLFGATITICSAQDKLVKTNGQTETVNVLEIKTEVITYKKYSNPTGPTYEILKSEVHKIIFKNGSEEIITALSKEGKTGIEFKFIGGDTIVVTRVPAGSPAEEIGIKEGDKIVQIGDKKVGKFSSEANVNDLLDGPPGSIVNISFVRGKLSSLLTLPVERRVKNWDLPKNDPIIYDNNYDNSNNNNNSSNDNSTNNSTYNSGTTTITNNADDNVGGFYVSIMPGIGGANFREPLMGVFEVEIGDCVPRLNTTFALKTAIYHLPESDDMLVSLKYSTTGYLGKYTKQGMFVGGDLGIAFYPAGDQPLWDAAATVGYSLKLTRNLRLEGVGSVNLMPTISFSNFGIGGFVGIRFGGIF
jgi:membrane-associated protease RseP (regulator of RpoE activity)